MGNRLIAVVDDDPLVRSATTSLLRSFGYDCCGFNSAEEFLRGDRRDYDCVVSDIQMPGMSGVELAHLLKEAIAQVKPSVRLVLRIEGMEGEEAQRTLRKIQGVRIATTLTDAVLIVHVLLKGRPDVDTD